MSPRTCARTLAFCLFALTLSLPLGCNSSAGGATGSLVSAPLTMDVPYSARAPRTCSPLTSPPSAAQASILVQCFMDGESALGLALIQDVKVQVGSSRKFDNFGDLGLLAIDPSAQVYPIQGSYTAYFCRLTSTLLPGQQGCLKSAVPQAAGWCWKTTFNDWRCKLQGAPPATVQSDPPQTF